MCILLLTQCDRYTNSIGSDIVISIVRIVEINSLSFDDITFASWGGHFWSMVEVAVAMIVACAPMCKQAIEELLPSKLKGFFTKMLSTRDTSRSNRSGLPTYIELNDYQDKDSEARAPSTLKSRDQGRVRVTGP